MKDVAGAIIPAFATLIVLLGLQDTIKLGLLSVFIESLLHDALL
jgi:hypothetical protein